MGSHTPSVIDGFSVLKAMRLGGETKNSPGQASAGRALRTTLPSRQEIVCYRCNHAFELLGRLRAAQCPSCRTLLRDTAYKVDCAWYEDIETIGRIHVTEAGVLKGGCQLVGGEVIFEGTIQEGRVRACQSLLLGSSAKFELSDVEALDLVVPAGVLVSFPGALLNCRNLAVEGELESVVRASGAVLVRTGGLLRGEVHSSSLIVEEGAGLLADLRVGESERE